ncbi:MAG: signal peptidase I [Thermoflexia bacterium]|nr:MAG: signal peptidase I [Thermoflexia bacterium]
MKRSLWRRRRLEPFPVYEEGSGPLHEPPALSARPPAGRHLLREIAETLLLALAIYLVINTLTGRFYVRGSSMEPSLHNGQYLIVSKISYLFGEPQRGDIVVFVSPNNGKEDYVKRIIGLPGERVEIRDGAVWINGYRLEEPYLSSATPYTGAWVLGPDEYFVLGDNRPNSSDSHTWGPLPRKNIIGKAWLCYWPPQYWGLIPHHSYPSLNAE